MPYYEYECPECGEIKEIFQKIDDRNNLPMCEKDGQKMKLLIGSPAIRKGAGIYSVDTSAPKMGDYES